MLGKEGGRVTGLRCGGGSFRGAKKEGVAVVALQLWLCDAVLPRRNEAAAVVGLPRRNEGAAQLYCLFGWLNQFNGRCGECR